MIVYVPKNIFIKNFKRLRPEIDNDRLEQWAKNVKRYHNDTVSVYFDEQFNYQGWDTGKTSKLGKKITCYSENFIDIIKNLDDYPEYLL